MSPGPGSIALTEDDGEPVLRFAGAIDKDAVRAFRRQVPPAAWPARVDLREASSLDPAGVELMVHLSRKQTRTGRSLQVSDPSAAVRAVLTRAGLDRTCRISASADDAG